MTVGTAVREARQARHLTQEEVGRRAFLSRSMVSAIERGDRKLPQDVSRQVAQEFDSGRLYSELAASATGEVLVGPWLDGDRVDLSRLAVRDKAEEELTEAVDALVKARVLVNARKAEDLTDEGRARIKDALHELIEALTAARIAIAVISTTYGFSVAQLYREHREELEAKGLVAKRKSAR